MILRLHTFLAGCLALLLAALLALAPASANPASGGYQLFAPIALEHQADIQLASLENFDYHAKIASECCNAPNTALPSYSTRQLQHEYKHAPDFGVTGNWNTANGEAFRRAIDQHITDPATTVIQGTYRGQPVTHHFNANTGNNVFVRPDGSFWGGWKLSPDQIRNVTSHGGLR